MEVYFAPNAVWKRPVGDIVGVEALRQQMAALKDDRMMRHVITNLRTRIVDADPRPRRLVLHGLPA